MNSIKNTARFAGLLYLIVFALGIFGEVYARPILIVPGDAAATAANIKVSESLFRLGFVSDLTRQVCLILLPLLLYKLLKPVNKSIALLMVVFALVAVPIAMLNHLIQFAALLPLSGAQYLTAFAADQLSAQVMLFLDLYELGTFVAQFLGFWVCLLGYLVFKSGFLPKILGILLIITGLGYLIDSIAFFLFPDAGVTISLFTFWGEALFALWLLIMGVNAEQWEKRALETA